MKGNMTGLMRHLSARSFTVHIIILLADAGIVLPDMNHTLNRMADGGMKRKARHFDARRSQTSHYPQVRK